MFNRPLGVVEMAEAVVAAAQDAGDRVAASPPGWILIDMFLLVMCIEFRSPHSVSAMLIVPSVVTSSFPRPLSTKVV